MSIQIQEEKTRLYLIGNTFPIKDAIKSAGGHWDPDRKAWWVGKAKRSQIEKAMSAKPTTTEGPVNVIGKAEYKGKKYFVRWAGRCANGQDKMRLTTLDEKIDFWADSTACRWIKRYQEPMTLSSIRIFIQEKKHNETTSRYGNAGWMGNGCAECRRLGDWCPRCAFDEFDN